MLDLLSHWVRNSHLLIFTTKKSIVGFQVGAIVRCARLCTVFLFMFSFLLLCGCPLMMPFMMVPMLSKTMNRPGEPMVSETTAELVHVGVNALFAKRGTYKRILLSETTVTGHPVPHRKFRGILLEGLRTKNGWVVFDQEEPVTGEQHDPQSSLAQTLEPLAVISAQLYQAGDQLWLALQLRDDHSKQLFWSGLYSRPNPKIAEINKSTAMSRHLTPNIFPLYS